MFILYVTAAPEWVSSHQILSTSSIPSGTDGWMEYVPISHKKNVTVTSLQSLKEGKILLLTETKQNEELKG